jgi:hypothetical protein
LIGIGLSFAAVQAASAAEYHTSPAPAQLYGWFLESSSFHIPGAGTVECSPGFINGYQSTLTTSEITLHPTYGLCKAFGFANTDVSTFTCDYTLTEPSKAFQASMHIVCGSGHSIEITPTVFGSSACTVTIGSQSPSGTMDIKNNGSLYEIDLTSTVTKIKHSAGCGASAASDATLTGSMRLRTEGFYWVG